MELLDGFRKPLSESSGAFSFAYIIRKALAESGQHSPNFSTRFCESAEKRGVNRRGQKKIGLAYAYRSIEVAVTRGRPVRS